jgi:hypothetical protein
MAAMSYLSAIERYHEYRDAIRELLASMVTGVAEASLYDDPASQRNAIRCLARHFPFVDMLFTLDAQGVQVSSNVGVSERHPTAGQGRGKNRSQRPYFLAVRDSVGVVVTDPYLSSASGNLCVSAAVKLSAAPDREPGFLVLDVDLAKTIAFLMGDSVRRRFQPFFRTVFSLIAVGLFGVAGLLLYSAFSDVISLWDGHADAAARHLKPFGAIIFLTLALAIFDLGKTILEEEVLMHKDIFRHSSTRRTITRFIAAILIAVSIEALLLMFKSALGDGAYMLEAVWMMFAAVGLLSGLGIYVNLGAKAEVALLNQKYARN